MGGLLHLRLVYQQAVKAEAKLDRVKGKGVAEQAKHQRMPDRHPKNRAGEIREDCQREQKLLQVGSPGLPAVRGVRQIQRCSRERINAFGN